MKHANPWGLTPREVECMDAFCDTGCLKLTAARLGISERTVKAHTGAAKVKMKQPTTLLKYLAWDRWRQCGSK